MSERLVHFPWMHPKLAQGPLPQGLVFLDPGVDLPEQGRWTPPDLPYTHQEVRRLLREYMEFAGRFPRTSDMQAYMTAGLENFYTDTTMDIKSQLVGGVAGESDETGDRLRKAQLFLAMALFREDQFAAMHGEEVRFAKAREGFAQTLGLDEEESFAELGVPNDVLFPRAGVDLPWRSVLLPMLSFLPAGTHFYVSDEDVMRELVSLDLQFEPCGHDGHDVVCCTLDPDVIERICGSRLELPSPVKLVARPLNP